MEQIQLTDQDMASPGAQTEIQAQVDPKPIRSSEKQPLGVGEIISDSFHILFSNFFLVILIGFIPALLGELVNGLINGFGSLAEENSTNFIGFKFQIDSISGGIIDLVAFAISTALLVQLAYDSSLIRPVKISRYLETAMRSVLPIAVLSLGMGAALFASILLIVIPAAQIGISPLLTFPPLVVLALWILAVLSAVAPAIVIERAGFIGFTRSIALTREYRWPIVGTIVLALILTLILSAMSLALIALFTSAGGVFGFVLGAALLIAVSTLATGLFSILFTLVYARLRVIKDGLGLKEVAAVFE